MSTEQEPLIAPLPTAAPIKRADGKDVDHDARLERDTLPETATVGRTIGTASAYILVMSRVIGSGIFAMPGTVLQSAGSPGLALLLWTIGALIAWCGLVIDLEYGCMFPRSGGIKVYLEHTYPHPRYLVSTLIAVHVVLLGFTASNCIVFAKYTFFAFDAQASDFLVKLVAVGLMTAITVVHGCFYRTGVLVQNVLGWLKIGLVLFMVLTGLFVVVFGIQRDSSSNIQRFPDLWKNSNWSYNAVATTFFKIFYSYAGLDNINNILNEVKNPVRTLRWVPPLSLLTACALYILINVAYLAVVPLKEIKQSRELISALFFERVFGSGIGNIVLPLGIALSAAGNVMVVTFSVARINQEVARVGFLPYGKILASSKPFNAPLGGLIVHYIPSVVVIVLPPSKDVYAFIAEIEAYTGQFFALAVAIGLVILRFREPDTPRPFRAWLSAVYVRIALCVSLIIAPLIPSRQSGGKIKLFDVAYAFVSISTIIIGVVIWTVKFRLLPRARGYQLVEERDVLDDGTTVSRVKHLRE